MEAGLQARARKLTPSVCLADIGILVQQQLHCFLVAFLASCCQGFPWDTLQQEQCKNGQGCCTRIRIRISCLLPWPLFRCLKMERLFAMQQNMWVAIMEQRRVLDDWGNPIQ